MEKFDATIDKCIAKFNRPTIANLENILANLGVDPAVLEKHGAVSEPVVRQMARGAARLCGAECAVSVSGVAGPGGGTPEKPVGTVWMAALVPEGCAAEVRLFPGDREAVRNAAQIAVLELLARALEGKIELSTEKSEKDLHI